MSRLAGDVNLSTLDVVTRN